MEIKHSAGKRKKPADWRRSVMARKAAHSCGRMGHFNRRPEKWPVGRL